MAATGKGKLRLFAGHLTLSYLLACFALGCSCSSGRYGPVLATTAKGGEQEGQAKLQGEKKRRICYVTYAADITYRAGASSSSANRSPVRIWCLVARSWMVCGMLVWMLTGSQPPGTWSAAPGAPGLRFQFQSPQFSCCSGRSRVTSDQHLGHTATRKLEAS